MGVQVAGDYAVDPAAVYMGRNGFVSAKEGASKDLIATLEKHLGADSGNRRRHGSGKNYLGRYALTDSAGN